MSFKGSKEIIESIENRVFDDLALNVLKSLCINDPHNPVIQEVYDHFEKYYRPAHLKQSKQLSLFDDPFPDVWEILNDWKRL